MIIYFMKQDALDFFKQNMDVLYTHYFTDDTNDWMEKEYGAEVFAVFKEIPDIELCELGERTAGEIDFENIQILYLALRNLSESQAAEERLWAGMCNSVFYDFLRRRWKYDENDISDADIDASAILSRFFFSTGVRGSYFRNTLAKCWWVGKLTYNESNEKDPFYALRAIGSADINSKITEIFYNNTFTSNPEILRGITDALGLFYEKGIYLPVREVLRPTLQYLNAIGGAILLDALSTKEITKITVDKINNLLKGSFSALTVDYEDDESDEDFDEQTAPTFQSIDEIENLVYDFDFEEPVYAGKGDRVRVLIEDLNREKVFIIPKDKDRSEMMLVEAFLLGKSVGDRFSVAKHKYIVKEIMKQ